MIVDSVAFGKYFGLTKTTSTSGAGSYRFYFNEGEGIHGATLNYDYYFQVSYVDTPRGKAIFQQSATFTMTKWTGIAGLSSGNVPNFDNFSVRYYNSSAQNIRTPFVPSYTPFGAQFTYGFKQKHFRSYQNIMLPKGTTTADAIFRFSYGGAMNGLCAQHAIIRF